MFRKLYQTARPLLVTNWGIAILLALFTYSMFWAVFTFQDTTFLTSLDNVDQTYSWYQKLATSWHDGYLPIWNANVYSGASFAGEIQTGVFYPLNWLWITLFGSTSGISEQAINYLIVTHFAVAAFGCYLLLREMRAKQWAAVLAGATFALSGVVAFRAISQTMIFFGLALIPYVVYFWAKYRNDTKSRPRWLLLSGAFLGLILLVGHIQPFFHGVLAVLLLELHYLYKGYNGWRKLGAPLWKSAKSLLIMVGAAAVIALPQLWVSASYLPDAYRIQAEGYGAPGEKIEYGPFSKAFNLDIHEFFNLIDPVSYPIRDGNNIFIGLAPLVVIIVVLVLGRVRLKKTDLWQRYGFFVNTTLIFSILAMLGYVTWFAVVLYELPFVYQIRQLGRYSILFDLALIMALAAALSVFAEMKLTKKQSRILLAVGIFLLINAAYLFLLRFHILSLHFALQVGLAALTILVLPLTASAAYRRIALIALLLITTGINTVWYMPKIQPDTKVVGDYTLPAELVQVLERTNGQYRVEDMDGALPLNVGNVYDVQMTWGYSATVHDNYYELRRKSMINPELIRDVLGVELITAKQPLEDFKGELQYSDPKNNVYVMRRSSVLPKAFVTDKPGSTDRQDYQGLVVLTKAYNDRYQRFEVELDSKQRVIMSELFYPGWEAKVDGKVVDLHEYSIGQYPLLKSLDVPAGKHTIELTYKPFKFF
jgi:hypothetical protein